MNFHVNNLVVNFFFLNLLVEVKFSFPQDVLGVQGRFSPTTSKVKISKDDGMCLKQVSLLVGGYKKKELWALKIFDSWGKSQSGLFSGNHMNFGHYEQCLAVKHKLDDEAGDYVGQHCMVFFKKSSENFVNSSTDKQDLNLPQAWPQVMHIELMRQYMNVYNSRMGTALCLPSVCSSKMVRQIADRMLSINSLKTTTDYEQEIFCNTINIREMRSIDKLAA